MLRILLKLSKLILIVTLLNSPYIIRAQCGSNPLPIVVASPSLQAVCSGSAITPISMSGNVTGLSYNWIRDNTTVVTGMAATGTGNISGTLMNNTNSPVTVSFTITPELTQLINEPFNTVSPLPPGWAQQNLSSSIGPLPEWFVGTAFSPYSPTAFIAASYENTTVTNTVSNWLFTPNILMKNGDQFSFYTRTSGPAPNADMLQVRMSINGASTNAGTTSASVGDFTQLLMVINPSLSSNGYVSTWTKYTVNISGLPPGNFSGRIAFRYFTIHGSLPGSNSSMIGIDDVVYTALNGTPCTGLATTVRVVVNPLPIVSIRSDITPPILPGQLLTLTANATPAGGVYAWFKDGVLIPGATNSTLIGITVNDLGTYVVRYTDNNGCVQISPGFVVYARPSGNLYMYPNPVNSQLKVSFYNQPGEEIVVTVYNRVGMLVLQQKKQAGVQPYSFIPIDLSQLASGSYFVEIRNRSNQLIGTKTITVVK